MASLGYVFDGNIPEGLPKVVTIDAKMDKRWSEGTLAVSRAERAFVADYEQYLVET